MTSHSDITRSLAKAIALRDGAEDQRVYDMGAEGVETYVELARDAGILKRPAKTDWSLLDR